MDVIKILEKVGAVLRDSHFVGTSGVHFDTYINKDFLYPHTKETSEICKLFAEKFKDENIDVVVGPALGGIILSQWTASHLSSLTNREVLAVYTEKSGDNEQVLKRGYDEYVKGKKVLIVEDNVQTGSSIVKVIKAVQAAGANIVGVCAMVNKNEDMEDEIEGVPFNALSNLFVPMYEEKDCPLCRAGVPINTKVGHGKKFLESQAAL
jgi:orotate phosphoribosyltransferase